MSARSRLRRPLPLDPRGSFVFTATTVSLDITAVIPGKGRRTLHVGRSKGAVEPETGPSWEVDAVSIVATLGVLDAAAAERGEPPPSAVIPAERLRSLRRTARAIVRTAELESPFAGRPRRCYPSKDDSVGESLWIATDTGETVIEQRTPALDERGRFVGLAHGSRSVSRREALEWLLDNGYRDVPVELIDRR